jgi:hypothetical protein
MILTNKGIEKRYMVLLQPKWVSMCTPMFIYASPGDGGGQEFSYVVGLSGNGMTSVHWR